MRVSAPHSKERSAVKTATLGHLTPLSPANMCGICVAHGLDKPSADRTRIIACSKKIRHRGPDWSGCYVGEHTIMVHERLAIVGVGESRLCKPCVRPTC